MGITEGVKRTSRIATVLAAALAVATALVALTVQSPGRAAATAPAAPPPTLRETGLYADWASRTVAAEHLPFTPQYPLWSDGATKKRWVNLPAGSWIDASDPDAWDFPVGTRIWKEFSFGRPVETRYMERTPGGWIYATYVWSADGREATLAPARGVMTDVVVTEGGAHHAIPGEPDCRVCHANGPTPVLGFSALQLSSDRDPLAPHAEAAPDGAVDLAALVERGLVRGLPQALVDTPPRIDARTPTERAALGYLHGNCSGCHQQSGPVASLGLSFTYDLDGGAHALDAIGRPSKFQPPGARAPLPRIAAGAPDESVVVVRMRARDPYTQMPPLGTRRVDEDAVRLITAWIETL